MAEVVQQQEQQVTAPRRFTAPLNFGRQSTIDYKLTWNKQNYQRGVAQQGVAQPNLASQQNVTGQANAGQQQVAAQQPSTGAVVGQQQMEAQQPVVSNTPDIRTDPYGYIMNKYAPTETREQMLERQRKENNRAQIAGMLGVMTGVGNMLVTSSNRFGRGVQTPDYAKSLTEGIATREAKRREEEKLAYEASVRDQQQRMAEAKMAQDADNNRWNRAFKISQEQQRAAEAAANREQKERFNAANLEQKALDRKQKDLDRRQRAKDNAANRQSRERAAAIRAAATRAARNGSGSKGSVYTFSIGNGNADIPSHSWTDSVSRHIYDSAVEESKKRSKETGRDEFFEANNWLEGEGKLKKEEMAQAISAYLRVYPDSPIAKKVLELQNASGKDDGDGPDFRL